MSEWQAIDTAPRDGTVVDLFGCLWPSNDPEVLVGYWDEKFGKWVLLDTGGVVFEITPTHWQPRPAPPTETGEYVKDYGRVGLTLRESNHVSR